MNSNRERQLAVIRIMAANIITLVDRYRPYENNLEKDILCYVEEATSKINDMLEKLR